MVNENTSINLSVIDSSLTCTFREFIIAESYRNCDSSDSKVHWLHMTAALWWCWTWCIGCETVLFPLCVFHPHLPSVSSSVLSFHLSVLSLSFRLPTASGWSSPDTSWPVTQHVADCTLAALSSYVWPRFYTSHPFYAASSCTEKSLTVWTASTCDSHLRVRSVLRAFQGIL